MSTTAGEPEMQFSEVVDRPASEIMTLDELKDTQVDMFTTVFIGNSQTRNIKGKMVTPRGYRDV